jgi:hypothetical protein
MHQKGAVLSVQWRRRRPYLVSYLKLRQLVGRGVAVERLADWWGFELR